MAIENYYGCPILNFDEISEWKEFKNNLYPNSPMSNVNLVQIYVEDCKAENINEILKSYPDRRTVFEILNLTPIFKNLYIDEPSVFFSCFIDDLAKFIDDMMTNGYYNIVMEDGVSTIKTLDANLKLLRWAKRISDARFYSRPLSPLEKFLMAYKYVTRYVYHETETKYYMNSRRVSSILNNKGKDIVCVGYSALLAELCKKIGFRVPYNTYTQQKKMKWDMQSLWYISKMKSMMSMESIFPILALTAEMRKKQQSTYIA